MGVRHLFERGDQMTKFIPHQSINPPRHHCGFSATLYRGVEDGVEMYYYRCDECRLSFAPDKSERDARKTFRQFGACHTCGNEGGYWQPSLDDPQIDERAYCDCYYGRELRKAGEANRWDGGEDGGI